MKFKQGDRVIIFGRNIFMADNPVKLVKALNEIMNNNVEPLDAKNKYSLK